MIAASNITLTDRARVCALAREWLMTPYRDGGRLKGIGADCTFVACVYWEAGLVPPFEIHPYSPQWGLNQSGDRYLQTILSYAREIEGPPGVGDLVAWKWGRCWSHSAIVVDPGWPRIVHAYKRGRFVIEDDGTAGALADCPRRFFSVFK